MYTGTSESTIFSKKNFENPLFGILSATNKISGSRSVSQWYGSADPYQNVTDPQQSVKYYGFMSQHP